MSLALPTSVAFISLMQSVNGTQFINVTLIPSPAVKAVTYIIPFASIYASL